MKASVPTGTISPRFRSQGNAPGLRPPRRAAELARVAAPGMLGAGATPRDLLVRRREFSPPDLVDGGGEEGMAVEMK